MTASLRSSRQCGCEPKMMVKEKTHYENHRVYAPDMTLMFRCGMKKIQWYLDRGLARILPPGEVFMLDGSTTDATETSIQLLFEPKGMGRTNEPWYLEDKTDICVVCGSKNQLTLHHIVPHLYRKHLPLGIKASSNHDLLLLCDLCHDNYERKALEVKLDFVKQTGVPIEGIGWIRYPQRKSVKSAASVLLMDEAQRANIPQQRIHQLEQVVMEFFGLNSPSEITKDIVLETRDLELVTKPTDGTFIDHGMVVVQRFANTKEKAEDFVRMWRRHFLEFTCPTFLSPHWKIENPVFTNVDDGDDEDM